MVGGQKLELQTTLNEETPEMAQAVQQFLKLARNRNPFMANVGENDSVVWFSTELLVTLGATGNETSKMFFQTRPRSLENSHRTARFGAPLRKSVDSANRLTGAFSTPFTYGTGDVVTTGICDDVHDTVSLLTALKFVPKQDV